MLQTMHATSTTRPGAGTRTWAWPPTETEIRLRGICWTSLRPDANAQSDPPVAASANIHQNGRFQNVPGFCAQKAR